MPVDVSHHRDIFIIMRRYFFVCWMLISYFVFTLVACDRPVVPLGPVPARVVFDVSADSWYIEFDGYDLDSEVPVVTRLDDDTTVDGFFLPSTSLFAQRFGEGGDMVELPGQLVYTPSEGWVLVFARRRFDGEFSGHLDQLLPAFAKRPRASHRGASMVYVIEYERFERFLDLGRDVVRSP
ncbi:MAG: hypothetical protein AAGI53_03215 [Planctomycetota bacterium]